RYAKNTANRNAISVRRAAYRNAAPMANTKTVKRIRVARESMRAIVVRFSPAIAAASPRCYLIADYLSSGVVHQTHNLELVVEPEAPVSTLGSQIKATIFLLRSADVELIPSGELDANRQGRSGV